MNREIKFRVWDKRSNGFVVNDENGSISFNLQDWAIQMGTCLIYPVDDYVFQQYTGLKDKEEKDVYEGDIISWKGEFIAEVYWSTADAAFAIRNNREGGALLNENYILNFEVIGNIFENPELLK